VFGDYAVMKKYVLIVSLISVLLCADHYPVLPLEIISVSGGHTDRWERDAFVDGVGHTLQKRGHIALVYNAPFVLVVRIRGYKRPDPHSGTPHRYRLKTRVKADFWVRDRWDYDVYSGSVDYALSLDAHTSGVTRAYNDARRRIFRGLGERVAERLDENFKFMVDFQRQQHSQKDRRVMAMSGQALLMRGETLDLESAAVSRTKQAKSDIGWYGDAYKTDMQRMVFFNGTRYGIAKHSDYRRIDRGYAKHMKLQGYDLFARKLHKGTVFVLVTAQGHYVKMRIEGLVRKNGIKDAGLRLRWEFLKR